MSAASERVVLFSGGSTGLGPAIARRMGGTEGRVVIAGAHTREPRDRNRGGRPRSPRRAGAGCLGCVSLPGDDPGMLRAFHERHRALVSLAIP